MELIKEHILLTPVLTNTNRKLYYVYAGSIGQMDKNIYKNFQAQYDKYNFTPMQVNYIQQLL